MIKRYDIKIVNGCPEFVESDTGGLVLYQDQDSRDSLVGDLRGMVTEMSQELQEYVDDFGDVEEDESLNKTKEIISRAGELVK